MQNITIKSLLGLLLTILVLEACSSKASDNKNESSAATEAAPGLPVDVQVVQETAMQQTEAVAGSVLPNRTVDIMSELSKKITAVNFKDGAFVGAGQVLYKLDDADIRAKLRQLQAELNLASISENRFRELLKTETVRQEEYDIALAKLQSLQAGKEILQVELSKTNIRAPFSGIVGITKVFAGTLVSPGLPLVSLQEQASLKIQFSISEKYLPIVKAGTKIQFSTELSDDKLTAKVVSTEASVDIQSRNIIVQAEVINTGNRLKAGMSAKIYFNTSGENAKAITIPTEALIPGTNGYSVFVVKNGIAKITAVSISNRNESSAWINKGLNNGDTIMISNILRSADGTPVRIVSITNSKK
ncbi:MAG: efflux RND transporter periplasmic adaptor subunit [Niabella sp.]|nr:MAG: efflux RND transporter periplasmic adaptor subunit [Niabella sp.]